MNETEQLMENKTPSLHLIKRQYYSKSRRNPSFSLSYPNCLPGICRASPRYTFREIWGGLNENIQGKEKAALVLVAGLALMLPSGQGLCHIELQSYNAHFVYFFFHRV